MLSEAMYKKSLSPGYICLKVFLSVARLCTLAHHRVAHTQLVWIGSTHFYNSLSQNPESEDISIPLEVREWLLSIVMKIYREGHGHLTRAVKGTSGLKSQHRESRSLNPTARSAGQLPTLARREAGSPAPAVWRCCWHPATGASPVEGDKLLEELFASAFSLFTRRQALRTQSH